MKFPETGVTSITTSRTVHLSSCRAGHEKQCLQIHQALPFAPRQSGQIFINNTPEGDFSHFFCWDLTITEQGVFDASVRLNPELQVSCNDFMGGGGSFLICLKISSPKIKLSDSQPPGMLGVSTQS